MKNNIHKPYKINSDFRAFDSTIRHSIKKRIEHKIIRLIWKYAKEYFVKYGYTEHHLKLMEKFMCKKF